MGREGRIVIYYGWFILASVLLLRLMSSGLRSAFGVFLLPLQEEFFWDRSTVAAAASVVLLVFALSQPLVGILVDRFGAKRVVALGSLLIALGHFLSGGIRSHLELYIYFGLIAGLGFGAITSVPGAVLITSWFRKRRGLAISLGSLGIAGGLLIVPPTALMIEGIGWRATYWVLGALTLAILIPVTLFVIRERPPLDEKGVEREGGGGRYPKRGLGTPLRLALKTRSFWFLFTSYTICGFTVFLVEVHLVAMASDQGIPRLLAASALGSMGIPMMVGVLSSGLLVDRFGGRRPLSLYYFTRGLALLIPLAGLNPFSLYIFVILFGLVELMTIPATITLCREIYGPASLGVIYGTIYGGHQLGGALSTYLGGLIFDLTGSYTIMLQLSIALLFYAALASYLIRDRPIALSPSPPMPDRS